MTAPEPSGEGAVRAMRQALAEGGFTPDDLGHLNAHGTSTHANDAMECAAALKALVGEERAADVPVTSVKGSIGHTLGAAGALEAIVCALSVANDRVPSATAGTREIDPECGVNVPLEPIEGYKQKVALSRLAGFWRPQWLVGYFPVCREIAADAAPVSCGHLAVRVSRMAAKANAFCPSWRSAPRETLLVDVGFGITTSDVEG